MRVVLSYNVPPVLMSSTNRETHGEDGTVPNLITRFASLVALLCGALVVVLPPWNIFGTAFMCILLWGLYRILQGLDFPNFWPFWLCAAIAFFLCSGVSLPISHWEMPVSVFARYSYCFSCFGAIITMIVGATQFSVVMVRDLLNGNVRYDDD